MFDVAKACARLKQRSHVERYSMPETNIIKQFVEKQVGTTIAPDEQEELYALVEDRLKDVLLDALSLEQLEDLNRRSESGMSDIEVQQFFLTAGVDYKPLMEKLWLRLSKNWWQNRKGRRNEES